MFKHKIAKQHV